MNPVRDIPDRSMSSDAVGARQIGRRLQGVLLGDERRVVRNVTGNSKEGAERLTPEELVSEALTTYPSCDLAATLSELVDYP